jgi:hypothetical protein
MRKLTASLVQAITTTAGTGNLTLASSTGFCNFSDRFANNDAVDYMLQDGNNKEWGRGTWLTGNILARTTVKGSLVAGVYSGSSTPITLSGGTTIVRAVITEELFSTLWKVEFSLQAGSFTAVDGFAYGLTANSIVVTLNASPQAGDRICVFQAALTITGCTVDPAGGKINGITGVMNVDTSDFCFVLIYIGASYGWKVLT